MPLVIVVLGLSTEIHYVAAMCIGVLLMCCVACVCVCVCLYCALGVSDGPGSK